MSETPTPHPETLAEIDPQLAACVRRAQNTVDDMRHAEEEERTGRLTIPDRPMSRWELQRLRRRNDNRERYDLE